MTTTDVRLFMEVTTRQTEEAFRRQMNETNGRVDTQRNEAWPSASGLPKAFREPRELWWSQPEGMPRISRAEKERNCE